LAPPLTTKKLKRARNAVPGNNASQPRLDRKPSMMLSYDSLENRYRQFEFTSLPSHCEPVPDGGIAFVKQSREARSRDDALDANGC
jgi:hypothetical protein